jgi:UDP-2,3-diacylglucosamine pyrophosphatase LpxH
MIILVLSDLHLGKGKFLKNGQLNLLEDFLEDEKFFDFCDYYSKGEFEKEEVHLVLNGDILNLIQIDVDGVYTNIIDDEVTIKSIDSIVKGHPKFFEGLRKFIKAPNKHITYIIGNHDSGMAFLEAQSALKRYVGDELQFCFDLNLNGVHIEHGHRFEVINTVPSDKYFMEGPNGKMILNLPWGSLFCINLLPVLRKDRPNIDKVRPLASYVKWCLFYDFSFFWKMSYLVTRYLIQSNFDEFIKQNRNFKTTISILKQITIYPLYGKKAKAILRRHPEIHTVVMGHTHVQEWLRFPENKYYFNTGTWNHIPQLDAGQIEGHNKFTYVQIKVDKENKILLTGTINLWQGTWKPYREDVSAS